MITIRSLKFAQLDLYDEFYFNHRGAVCLCPIIWDKTMKDKDKKIKQDILMNQRFSMGSAISRAGEGMLQGASAVPRLRQARAEIFAFIDKNISDSSGALIAVLREKVKLYDSVIASNFDAPIAALKELLDGIMSNEAAFYEFVRQADVKCGQLFQERPYFQQPGQEAHVNDEYTHESVRACLTFLLDAVCRSL